MAKRKVVWGTEPFIRGAKKGENEGRVNEIIEEMERLTDEIVDLNVGTNPAQKIELRNLRDDLNDIIGDYEVYYEE